MMYCTIHGVRAPVICASPGVVPRMCPLADELPLGRLLRRWTTSQPHQGLNGAPLPTLPRDSVLVAARGNAARRASGSRQVSRHDHAARGASGRAQRPQLAKGVERSDVAAYAAAGSLEGS
eukprot:scaffold1243_cov403-Prasinococcus_capsulatus_cf.AAC.6